MLFRAEQYLVGEATPQFSCSSLFNTLKQHRKTDKPAQVEQRLQDRQMRKRMELLLFQRHLSLHHFDFLEKEWGG